MSTATIPKGFQVFDPREYRASRRAIDPIVTIRPEVFNLNHAAYERLGKPEAVVLLFDHESGDIGLRGAPASERNAYPVRKQAKSANYVVSARAFLKHFSVSLASSLQCPAILVDGVLTINPSNGIPARKGPRRR
jgi:hypothetical protein